MRRLFQTAVVICAFGLIAACTQTPPQNNFPELTFDHVEKIKLDVASIQVIPAYQSSLEAPYVDHEMPVSLLSAGSNWARHVLVAAGDMGTATVTIQEASVIEEKLTVKDGISGMLTNDQSEKYVSKLAVTISIQDPSGSAANTEGSVTRSITVAEDITLNDREKVWFYLVEKTANDLDAKMRENISRFLSSYQVQ